MLPQLLSRTMRIVAESGLRQICCGHSQGWHIHSAALGRSLWSKHNVNTSTTANHYFVQNSPKLREGMFTIMCNKENKQIYIFEKMEPSNMAFYSQTPPGMDATSFMCPMAAKANNSGSSQYSAVRGVPEVGLLSASWRIRSCPIFEGRSEQPT